MCSLCGQVGEKICQQCVAKISVNEPYCYVCKKYSSNFIIHDECQKHLPLKQVIVLSKYSNPQIKNILHRIKYYKEHSLGGMLLKKHSNFFHSHIEKENTILCPVPIHLFKRVKRGYNQSYVISRHLHAILNKASIGMLVRKNKITQSQSHLSRQKRQNNLSGVFSVIDKNHTSKIVYIVDDVASTGSTLNEIYCVLKKSGYNDVRAIVIASD